MISQTTGFREEDIRPSQLMLEKASCIERDRQFLLSHSGRWVHVPCPACDCQEGSIFGEKTGFTYTKCKSCGTVFTNPRPNEELLAEFYSISENYTYWNNHIFPATEMTRREKIFKPRVTRVCEIVERLKINTGTILEIGAGFGTFCEEMKTIKLFDRVVALEPTPALAATCRKRGLETIESTIENLHEPIVADVVVAFEVLEHLFSPERFLRQCRGLLGPKGLIILSCPNVLGFDTLTLNTLSNVFDHEHLNYFHPASLSGLLSRCGYGVLELQTPGKLDCDIVKNHLDSGKISFDSQPFLRYVFEEQWDQLGAVFQSFLTANMLSSHMWAIARP